MKWQGEPRDLNVGSGVWLNEGHAATNCKISVVSERNGFQSYIRKTHRLHGRVVSTMCNTIPKACMCWSGMSNSPPCTVERVV